MSGFGYTEKVSEDQERQEIISLDSKGREKNNTTPIAGLDGPRLDRPEEIRHLTNVVGSTPALIGLNIQESLTEQSVSTDKMSRFGNTDATEKVSEDLEGPEISLRSKGPRKKKIIVGLDRPRLDRPEEIRHPTPALIGPNKQYKSQLICTSKEPEATGSKQSDESLIIAGKGRTTPAKADAKRKIPPNSPVLQQQQQITTRTSRRRKTVKFVGRRINHKWILNGKTKWYKGNVLEVIEGRDGDTDAVYEILYDKEDDAHDVDNLKGDLDEGSVKFIDISAHNGLAVHVTKVGAQASDVHQQSIHPSEADGWTIVTTYFHKLLSNHGEKLNRTKRFNKYQRTR